MNPNAEATQTVINPVPRSRLMKASNTSQLDPKQFHNELTLKLEKVKEEREAKDHLERTLNAMDPSRSKSSTTLSMPSQAQQKALTAAIFKKFSQPNEDDDQDILDQHVSRVFSPHLSPGTISPCIAAATASRPLPPLPQRIHESSTEISVTAGKN